MYQMTKISYHSVIECWDPKTNDLDPIKVTREIPQIDILLRKLEYGESCSDFIEINNKCDNLNIFLDIPPMKKTTYKRKQHKVRLGELNDSYASGMGAISFIMASINYLLYIFCSQKVERKLARQ